MKNNVERLINNIYNAVYKKIFNKQNIDHMIRGERAQIENYVNKLQESELYDKFCKEFAKRLTQKGLNKQKGLWRKFYQAAKSRNFGVLPDTYSDFEKNVMQKAIAENFKMIKSMPQEVLKVYKYKLTNTLINQVALNKLGRKAFEKQLKKHNAKNAKLIARTEASKLQTTILQTRSTELGSVAYIWKSSKDIRTRPSHRAMNGVIVFWRNSINERPLLDNMRGNAGEFPNCRCTPQPIFRISDLKKPTYQIYNYKTNKVEVINKNEITSYLTKGEL